MRYTLPENKKLACEMTMPLRWGDMDAMGHVNNTLYFRYCETIRIEWTRKLGANFKGEGEGIVVVNAFCNFIRQLEYPGDIVVKMYVSDPGSSSFETWYDIERSDEPGVVYCNGGATTVWVDYAAQKSRPLPQWLRDALA